MPNTALTLYLTHQTARLPKYVGLQTVAQKLPGGFVTLNAGRAPAGAIIAQPIRLETLMLPKGLFSRAPENDEVSCYPDGIHGVVKRVGTPTWGASYTANGQLLCTFSAGLENHHGAILTTSDLKVGDVVELEAIFIKWREVK